MVANGPDEMLLIIRDITQRTHAKRALEESESSFRSIAESLTNPLQISRLSDRIILYANKRFYEALKLANVDLVGKPAPDFYAHPEERKKLIVALKKHGHVYDWKLELVRPNGEHFWVMFSASTLNYDGEEALIVSYVDITEQRIAHAQLLQASKMATIGEMSAGVAHEINTPLATILLSSHNIQLTWKTAEYAEIKKNLDLIDDEVNRTSKIIQQMLNFSRNAVNDEWMIIDIRNILEQIILILKRQLETKGIEVIIKLGRKPLHVYGNPRNCNKSFTIWQPMQKMLCKILLKRNLSSG